MLPVPPNPAAAEPLKVMSYNIRYGTANDGDDRWEVRRPRTLSLIRKESPDLMGLQEALDFQIEEIRSSLPNMAAVGVGRDDAKSAGEFSPILYNTQRLQLLRSDTFWFSDTPAVPASKHWGNNITRVCTWAFFRDLKTGKYVWHYNLHIDHQSQPSRIKSAELLAKRIAERGTDDPVLVSGDFNVGEDNPVVSTMRENGYRDSFRMLHSEEKEVGTFNGFKDLGVDKIDYIWVSAGVQVERAEIVRLKIDGRWPSDHCPVTAWVVL